MIDGKTRICGLFGNPVEHTLSPVIHNTLAKRCGINMVYVPFLVDGDHVKQAVEGARALLQKPDPEGEIRRLLAVRNPIYEQAADRVVDVDGKDFEELLEEILDGTDIQPEGRLK